MCCPAGKLQGPSNVVSGRGLFWSCHMWVHRRNFLQGKALHNMYFLCLKLSTTIDASAANVCTWNWTKWKELTSLPNKNLHIVCYYEAWNGKKEMLLLSITGSPAHLFKAALHDFFLCDNTSIYQVSTTRCGHIHACEHFVLTESFEFKSWPLLSKGN